jgi:NAD(P)-dependent dehydrogenase (short-subunit alcohol dehydrogenase family)
MRSTEQVVVISGAASGIGLELGRLLRSAVRASAQSIVTRRGLEAFASELRKNGARCATAAADVRQREQVQDAVVRIVATTGPPTF